MKKYFKMLGNILLYLVIYFAMQILAGIALSLGFILTHRGITQQQITDYMLSSAMVGSVGAAIISFFIYKAILKGRKENIFQLCNFKKVETMDVVCIILLSVGLSILSGYVVEHLINVFNGYKQVSNNIRQGMSSPLGLLSGIVLIPIFEEILFRGLIFNELRKNINLVASVIIAALIFGMAHGNILQGIYASLLGVVLTLVYYWTKSLVASIIAHMTYNFMGTVGMSLLVGILGDHEIIYCSVAAVLLVVFLAKLYKNTHKVI